MTGTTESRSGSTRMVAPDHECERLAPGRFGRRSSRIRGTLVAVTAWHTFTTSSAPGGGVAI
jgi:hypothetical protein